MTVPNVTDGQTIVDDWGNQVALDVNDLLGRMTSAETSLANIVLNRSWTPVWAVGGVTVNQRPGLTYARYVDLGAVRIGVFRMTADLNFPNVPPGGFIIGDGFWQTGSMMIGSWSYFENGVTNHAGTVREFDTTSAGFIANGNNNIFGITPSIGPSFNDVFAGLIVAFEVS